uniref:Peroxiredoxin-like protein DDB_G0282517, mitochondrial n=1 Tax=Lygus hesperus TaxID=30085 RepID=A0A0A9YH19_LYGHE
MLNQDHIVKNRTLTARNVFFISPDKKICAIIVYPASTGRDFAEILRVLDSLQLTTEHPVATPANWQSIDDDIVVVPYVPTNDAKKLFPDLKIIRPYLRFAKLPK